MHLLTLTLSLLSSAFALETTTLLLLGFDKQSILGSVISADSTATTYVLSCPSGTDASDCGVPPNFTFTQGPSTMHYKYTIQADDGVPETLEAGCQITTDHGSCSSSMASAGPTMIGLAASVFPYSNYGTNLGAQVVTIVQAAAAPGQTGSSTIASTSATTTSAQPGKTSTNENGNASSGPSTATTIQNSSPTSKLTSSTSVSTAGVPMITGHAHWVIGGAAAAAALVAI